MSVLAAVMLVAQAASGNDIELRVIGDEPFVVGDSAIVELVVRNPRSSVLHFELVYGWCSCTGPSTQESHQVQPQDRERLRFPVLLREGSQSFESTISLRWEGVDSTEELSRSTSVRVTNPFELSVNEAVGALDAFVWRRDGGLVDGLEWSPFFGDAIRAAVSPVDSEGVAHARLELAEGLRGPLPLVVLPVLLRNGAIIASPGEAQEVELDRRVQVKRTRQGVELSLLASDVGSDFRWISDQPGRMIELYSDQAGVRKFRSLAGMSSSRQVTGSILLVRADGTFDAYDFGLPELVVL